MPGRVVIIICLVTPCVIAAGCCVVCSGLAALSPSTPQSPAKTIPKASAQLQQRRLDLLHEMMRLGIVAKLETPDRFPHLWVQPAFLLLDFEKKNTLCDMAFCYAYQLPQGLSVEDASSGRRLIIVHNLTGKRIGTYDPSSGLELE